MVFAGPNGSGKTSVIEEIKQTGLATVHGVYPVPARFINPDQVAKDLKGNFADQNARDEAAQAAAIQARAEAIASKLPFAFETVMSHPSRINEMLMLKEQGYRLFLTFITTDNPETNVNRVKFRYETGTTTGHYVAPDKVRERYERTMALLPRAAEVADNVYIYDNSVGFTEAKLQAVIERNIQFAVAPHAKDWVIKRLVHPLKQREREKQQLTAELEKKGYAVIGADELRGKYSGPVLLKTTYFLGQLDTATGNCVIHDRLMLGLVPADKKQSVSTLQRNDQISISYSSTSAPHVEKHAKTVGITPKSKTAISPKTQR